MKSSKFLSIGLSALLATAYLSSCSGPDDPPTPPIGGPVCEVFESTILTGTCYETKVYKFVSDTEGPKVAIVGGIHGDETAGWKAGLELVKRTDFKGTVLIIPQANILADTLVQRYAGQGSSGKITTAQAMSLKNDDVFKSRDIDHIKNTKYSDLNRTFPGSSSDTDTKKIAYEVFNTVKDFAPDYCVDLHESRHDYRQVNVDSTYLGSVVIYGGQQSCGTANKIADKYNSLYVSGDDLEFAVYEGTVSGSFCNTMGATLTNTKVFTFETNREYVGGVNTIKESIRVEQQLRLVDILLDQAYADYVKTHSN